ncbi:MAG: radical SAM family heme chaperone HemW [Ginsengibacter sp.]
MPFCKQACYYCNFHFSTTMELKNKMTDAICKELDLRKISDRQDISIINQNETIETIYFGGGTPSLLTPEEIARILLSIGKNYTIEKDVEITLEANPDDITIDSLKRWKHAGINRLSIGIQSFIERDLLWMNRVHNSLQALNCIRLAIDVGFHNYSIDLIFGIPGLSNLEWIDNVQTVIDLNVPHIACYALTVEPKTALYKMIALKKKKNIDNDLQAVQYAILMKMMTDAGYEHYEISNFAKPGYRSRHNSSYWQGKKYIGIGPSAHSYDGKNRMWNVANNSLYIQAIGKDLIPFEEENLTASQMLNEYVMVSLRTIEGINLKYIEARFSLEDKTRIEKIIEVEIEEQNIIRNEDQVYLTDKGKLIADGITVKLFSEM